MTQLQGRSFNFGKNKDLHRIARPQMFLAHPLRIRPVQRTGKRSRLNVDLNRRLACLSVTV